MPTTSCTRPQPVLMCVATRDFFDIHGAWDTFRLAKRLYTRLGWSERVKILENDAGHNFDKRRARPSPAGYRDGFTAYLLGRSCVGLRAENILVAARLKEQAIPENRPRSA